MPIVDSHSSSGEIGKFEEVAGDPGVVDCEMQGSEVLLGRHDGPLDIIDAADIARENLRFPTLSAISTATFSQCLLSAAHQTDLRASLGK